ncbi:SIR2-domain-containing protein [Macrolepiota fuliginosa MF-IS2]|uniref:SIR2-domain-containing protein n=1 Tax=Macrolepiota fuliginosa MF-IS2 TaxID=1400762 RepID=A0A9P6C0C7_9AGAR|nr:SIR2-domain-containing protein [Macrolepiota fuliginosa MF-IS2]
MTEPRESSSSREASPLSDEESLLTLQIQAFLEASEDVDIDQETVVDLMQVLSEHQSSGKTGVIDVETTAEAPVSDHRSRNQRNETSSSLEEAEPDWTKQEVKQMLHHLKERGMSSFIKEYVLQRALSIPRLLEALGISLCHELKALRPQTLLYFLRVAMSHQLRMRDRLGQYGSIEDALKLIQTSKRILILTGAGISVSCGIPDFRSRDGLYASLKARGDYDLDDPQQMFDIQYFRENPSVFYSFANQIYPSNFSPSPCHRFIKCIEDRGKLLRNYTQNIDTLETLAGVQRVLQCHGSFATATCLQCRRKVPGAEIEAEIMARKVPLCPICNPPNTQPKRRKQTRKQAKGQWDSDAEDESDTPEYPPGIIKPDITFFGEKLDDQFDRALAEDRDQIDLLIVIGTSLKVSPVAEIINHLPHSVPQILINKTPIRHINPDIVLLGNADDIILHLCGELGWDLPPFSSNTLSQNATGNSHLNRDSLKKRPFVPSQDAIPPTRVGNSHVWLFSGAEGGKWLDSFRQELAQSQSALDSDNATGDVATPVIDDTRDPIYRDVKKQKLN